MRLSLKDLIMAYASTVDKFTTQDVIDSIPDYAVVSVRCMLSALKNEGRIKNLYATNGRGNAYVMKAVK